MLRYCRVNDTGNVVWRYQQCFIHTHHTLVAIVIIILVFVPLICIFILKLLPKLRLKDENKKF